MVAGLEGFSPSHSSEKASLLQAYAREHQLLLTGGDGHGSLASYEKYAIGVIDIDDAALNLGRVLFSRLRRLGRDRCRNLITGWQRLQIV